jgi:BolA protein
MSIVDTIRAKIEAGLTPDALEVINESHLHAGHQGSPGSGESHFRLKVIATAFAGKSRLERHRMVNDLLADELAGPVHALAVRASAPDE